MVNKVAEPAFHRGDRVYYPDSFLDARIANKHVEVLQVERSIHICGDLNIKTFGKMLTDEYYREMEAAASVAFWRVRVNESDNCR